MKRLGRILGYSILGILSVFGVFFIFLIISYWSVIDKVWIRPCHYFPEAFADCREL